MLSSLFAGFLKKYSPTDAKGLPRPLDPEEVKKLLDALRPVLEGMADFADKHSLIVPSFEVEAKGVRVKLSVERLPKP